MELRHLRYFCAVADTLNFSRAAERIRVAQPALSRQIRDLENEIGFQLFVRTTTRVQLTDAGKQFYAAVQKILSQLAIAVSNGQQVAAGRGGSFNIGSDWRLPIHLVPETVRKFRQLHPQVEVNFNDFAIIEQIDALRAGKIHLGFVPEIALGPRDDLEVLHIYTGRLMVILPAAHPIAAYPVAPLRELSQEKWVTAYDGKNPNLRQFLVQMCRPAGFTPKFGRTATSAQGLLALVAAGEGIALLPELVIPHDFGGVSPVQSDCPPMKMYAVWLKKSRSPLVEKYIEILKEEIDALLPKAEGKPPRLRRAT